MKLMVIMYQDFSRPLGAARKYLEMIEYFINKKYFSEIILICSKKPMETLEGITIYETKITPPTLKEIKEKGLLYNLFSYFIFYLYQSIFILKILKKYKNEKLILHIRHDTYSIPSSLISSILYKHIIIADGRLFSPDLVNIFSFPVFLIKTVLLLESLVLNRYTIVYTYSLPYKYELLNALHFKEKIKVIPSSINIWDSIKYNISRKNKEKFVILYFGGLYTYYSIDTLLEAFKIASGKCSHLHLHIIGDGEAKNYLANLIKSLGIEDKVRFMGYLPKQKLLRFLSSVYITVNPTMPFAGVLTTKKLEAWNMGNVILEVNPQKSRYKHYEPPDKATIYYNTTQDLANKILTLIGNPKILVKHSYLGRKILKQRYNANKNYHKLYQMITKLQR